jgi:FkbM family methyltransferase
MARLTGGGGTKMNLVSRIEFKLEQMRSFALDTRTPISLIADSLKLKRRPFIATSKDGIKLRLEPGAGESFTFFENLIRRDYLSGGIKLKPGDTVVDIGANIGSFSVLAASLVGPKGRVVCFEPIPDIADRLKANIALNEFTNVVCIVEAVEAATGCIDIHVTEKSSLSTAQITRTENNAASRLNVPTTTLAHSMERLDLSRINLLKVDCEGSEYGIFETMSPETANAIDQIAIEPHQVQGRTKQWLAKRIESLGFDVQVRQFCWVAFRITLPRRA